MVGASGALDSIGVLDDCLDSRREIVVGQYSVVAVVLDHAHVVEFRQVVVGEREHDLAAVGGFRPLVVAGVSFDHAVGNRLERHRFGVGIDEFGENVALPSVARSFIGPC